MTTPTLLTDADLEKMLRRLNRKYFYGKLSVLYVRFERLPHGCIGNTKAHRPMFRKGPDSYAIRLDVSLKKKPLLCEGTLLHEMAHVDLNLRGVSNCCAKGKNLACFHFQCRMLELAKAGAFNGIW